MGGGRWWGQSGERAAGLAAGKVPLLRVGPCTDLRLVPGALQYYHSILGLSLYNESRKLNCIVNKWFCYQLFSFRKRKNIFKIQSDPKLRRALRRHPSLTVHILVRSGAVGPGRDWILRGSFAATLKYFWPVNFSEFSLYYWTVCLDFDDTFMTICCKFVLCSNFKSYSFFVSQYFQWMFDISK